MNQKTKKYTGLLAILPLFLVALTPSLIGAADAAEGPQVELTKVIREGENAYDVVFKVSAGSEDLKEGRLIVTSDSWQREALVRSIDANSFTSTNQIRVIAEDPSTISAEYVMYEPEVDFPNRENSKANLSGVDKSNNSFRADRDLSDFEKKINTFRN